MGLFNKQILKDFTKERYMAIVKSHPNLQEERAQIYTMLILTLVSLSFLGIFAINPTLTTIFELNRKLDDSEFVSDSLKAKIANLSSLNTEFDALTNTWPLVENAVPENPEAARLLGQLQAIAKTSNVTLTDMRSSSLDLPKSQVKKTTLPKSDSFVFSITAKGDKDSLIRFADLVLSFDRVVTLESISYSNEAEESLTVKGRVFFTL